MSHGRSRRVERGVGDARVLVVGESAPLAGLVDAKLRDEGMSPTTCTSSREALAALLADRFDAVVFDAALHDTDRARLVRTLRVAVARNALPIVVLTPSGMPADRSGRELVLGARETLRMPFTGGELMRKLRLSLLSGTDASGAGNPSWPAAASPRRHPVDGG